MTKTILELLEHKQILLGNSDDNGLLERASNSWDVFTILKSITIRILRALMSRDGVDLV